jgi:hypothetical protein
MKNDTFFQENGELNLLNLHTQNNEDPIFSQNKTSEKKKKSKNSKSYFTEEEKQFKESTRGTNLFKMFFS